MTNAEKFKTAEERARAFVEWCSNRALNACAKSKCNECRFSWLDLEAEEVKPLPCPFCGGESLRLRYVEREGYAVLCGCCRYKTPAYESEAEAIAAHNRVARAVMEAGKKEEKE